MMLQHYSKTTKENGNRTRMWADFKIPLDQPLHRHGRTQGDSAEHVLRRVTTSQSPSPSQRHCAHGQNWSLRQTFRVLSQCSSHGSTWKIFCYAWNRQTKAELYRSIRHSDALGNTDTLETATQGFSCSNGLTNKIQTQVHLIHNWKSLLQSLQTTLTM